MTPSVRARSLGGGWRLVSGRLDSRPVLVAPDGEVFTDGASLRSRRVAELLDVSPQNVRMLRYLEHLKAFPSGNTYEILVSSLIDYLLYGTPRVMRESQDDVYRSSYEKVEGYKVVREADGFVVETPFGPTTGQLGETFESAEKARAAIKDAIREGFPDLPIAGGSR